MLSINHSTEIPKQVEPFKVSAQSTRTTTPSSRQHLKLANNIHRLRQKYGRKNRDESSDDENEDLNCCPRAPITSGPSPSVAKEHDLARLLKNNRQWAKAIRERQPDFFEKGYLGQQPKVLWIGCSDSRVPENELLQLAPGEVFTHRNIANVVVNSDLNCLSVVQYAVDVLKVQHVIVCGHYGCGGVAAALGDNSFGLIDHWLSNIKDVKQQHFKNLETIEDTDDRCRALVELNARNSVLNIAKSQILTAAWARGQSVEVFGMTYDIKTGLLSELGYVVSNPQELAAQLKVDSDTLFTSQKVCVQHY